MEKEKALMASLFKTVPAKKEEEEIDPKLIVCAYFK